MLNHIKNQAAAELSKLGASKGGKARAASMTPEQRSEVARKAAVARWARKIFPDGDVKRNVHDAPSEYGEVHDQFSSREKEINGAIMFGAGEMVLNISLLIEEAKRRGAVFIVKCSPSGAITVKMSAGKDRRTVARSYSGYLAGVLEAMVRDMKLDSKLSGSDHLCDQTDSVTSKP